jgi:transposase
MVMLAEHYDFIIGGDPDRDTIDLAILDAVTGRVHTQYSDAADGPAYRRMLAWAVRCAPGRRVWALEGTGSFAAGLVSVLAEAGEDVVEIQNNKRSRGAKNDRIDAVQAARTALAQTEQATPRARGLREALRQALVTRQGILMSRTKAINELKSLIVVAPEHLRAQLRGLGLAKQLARIDRFPSPTGATIEHRVTVRTPRSIAARIRFLINQAAELDVELLVLVPQHPARAGVAGRTRCRTCRGRPAPGQLVPSRTRSQRSSVRLSRRLAPLEASSGQRTRHRLSRMGDRNLNRALHTVAITRLRCHEDSRNYETRRSAEGKTHRDVRRSLKRILARRFYRLIQAATVHANTADALGKAA